MFAAGRIEVIRELLQEQKKIEVLTLVKLLNVSEATVRRDLEKLENEGFLYRTHGGAVLIEQEAAQEIEVTLSEEKQQIALQAASFVNNNEIIYIGAGSTCLACARMLKEKKDLTIVSNNVLVATELAGLPNINLVLLGGSIYYRDSSISLVGEFAHHMLDNMYVDKVFLSADGVDIDFGFSCSSSEMANISKRAMKMSKEIIMLCDHTKFGRKALVKLCDLNDVSTVVTDQHTNAQYKSFFFENNIPLLVKYDV